MTFLNRRLGTLAACWGLTGTIGMLLFAVVRMCRHTMAAFEYNWSLKHYLVLCAWVVFMAYSEGYRGFQRNFSPRVAARSLYLRDRATPLRSLLAPLFCMAFFHAPPKRRVVVTVLTIMIAAIVVLFQYIPQPWRGILDFGVTIGLSWGIASILYFVIKYWTCEEVPLNAEVVEPAQS